MSRTTGSGETLPQPPPPPGRVTQVLAAWINVPSSWWKGSFSGFSSRDFSTPWAGGIKVGFIGRGLAIFSICLEGQPEKKAVKDEVDLSQARPNSLAAPWKSSQTRRETPKTGLRTAAGRRAAGCLSSKAGWQIAGGGGRGESGALYTPRSMCGDGRRWRQTDGRAGTLLAARSVGVGKTATVRLCIWCLERQSAKLDFRCNSQGVLIIIYI